MTGGEPAPVRLLVVEDDPQFRNYLRELLEGDGYVVVLASNGEEALDRYEESAPDLVITDLVMPDSDGVELIMQLRHVDRDTPVVAISGGNVAAAESYLKVAEVLGANAILEKPFSAAALRSKILSLLGDRAPD